MAAELQATVLAANRSKASAEEARSLAERGSRRFLKIKMKLAHCLVSWCRWRVRKGAKYA